METIELLKAINDANFDPWDAKKAGELRQFLSEYGYSNDKNVPDWFHRTIERIHARKPDAFLYDYNNQTDSDMGSLLLELNERYGWNIDDYGEGVVLLFPASKMRAFISREARHPEGRSCNSVSIESIR